MSQDSRTFARGRRDAARVLRVAGVMVAFGLAAAPADAGTLNGTTLSGGAPVAVFVSVTGANGRAATTSDASGAFSVTLPDGSYQVAADGPGYAVASATVNLTGTTSTTLTLTRTASKFSPLPVFGSAIAGVASGGAPGVFYAWDNVVPQLFRTDDYGGSWLPVTVGYDDPANGLPKNAAVRHGNTNALVTTSGFPGEVALYLRNGPTCCSVYYSTDYGVTWNQVANAPVTPASGPGPGPGTPGSLYWGHVGSTDVLLAQLGAVEYVAEMSAASPSFTQMSTSYTPASTDIMTVADGADQPWVAVAHATGSVDVYPLTTALTPPAPTTTATGFPANPIELGFGGASTAGHSPSALLVTSSPNQPGSTASVAMALKAPGADTFGAPDTATEPAHGMNLPECAGNQTGPGNIGMAVAPSSGGTSGGGFSGSCYVQDASGALTLDHDYFNFNLRNEGFSFDSAYNGGSDSVVLVAQPDYGYGVLKSATAGGDGAPSFSSTQNAGAGASSGSGGIAVRGITTAIVDDTAFGPAGVNDVATAVDPAGGDVSLASDNGGASTNVAVNLGAVSTAWWHGASGNWLLFGATSQFGQQQDQISAFENWSSSTPAISAPNLQGSDATSLGKCGSSNFASVWVDALASVPGADEFFAGETQYCGGNSATGGEVRLLTITPGSPPSIGTNTQIAAAQVTTPVADLAYCPTVGSASSIADSLFIAEGQPHYAIANGNPNGALLRVSGATGSSPTVTTVASVPSPVSVNVVRADCASGAVYVGVGSDVGGQNQPPQVYKSTDGGQTFTATTAPCGQNFGNVSALAMDPSNDNVVTVAVGGQGFVCSSADGGATWTVENDPLGTGFDFDTFGVLDLEIPPPVTTAAAASFMRPSAFTASLTTQDALAATGGGEFAADVRTTAVPVPTSTTAPPSAAAPTVRSFSITNERFAVGPKPTAISARARRHKSKRGTTFRYTLSAASTATLHIVRKSIGRMVGRKCVPQTKRNTRKRRCTRYTTAGTLTRKSKQGKNTLAFSGRIGRRALKRGTYRATITARIGAGPASKPRSLSFTIVRA